MAAVSVIDTVTQCLTDTIDVGGHPEALALSSDGNLLHVGDYWSGSVAVLSVQPWSARRLPSAAEPFELR